MEKNLSQSLEISISPWKKIGKKIIWGSLLWPYTLWRSLVGLTVSGVFQNTQLQSRLPEFTSVNAVELLWSHYPSSWYPTWKETRLAKIPKSAGFARWFFWQVKLSRKHQWYHRDIFFHPIHKNYANHEPNDPISSRLCYQPRTPNVKCTSQISALTSFWLCESYWVITEFWIVILNSTIAVHSCTVYLHNISNAKNQA